ncbi:MAG: flotillin family protein [Phycisphaerae bacterium]
MDAQMLGLPFLESTLLISLAIILLFVLFVVAVVVKCYHKVQQGQAIIRNGVGGTKVSFSGMVVIPVIHRFELMDISLKRVEIDRAGAQGLICKDHLRADIQVAFFMRVNNTIDDVMKVAQSIGCERASDIAALVQLYDAKFSEALKTVGIQFDFVELYNSRERFKEEILRVIGTDLNGFVLDDAAIDYLEQTSVDQMEPNNILDAEGIKKITDLTAREAVKANYIERDKEKTITQQNVEAQEAILELNKQLAEAEQKQKREVATITSREEAETRKVAEEERLKSESARIATDEEVQVAEENKNRQIIVAARNRERTDKVEAERVERERALEQTERERVVALAQIDKDKAVEVEKREIQNVIRERVIVERAVVEEEEKIKDTHEFATADRKKRVSITNAEEEAQQTLVKQVQASEAEKQAAERLAEKTVIEAEAARKAAERNAEAKKTMADAQAEEEAVLGMAEVRVMEARAHAIELEGTAQAKVISEKGSAEAEVISKKGGAEATVTDQKGSAEAKVMAAKYEADADGITRKAEAMKLFDAVGKEHEEFKLRLNKDKEVELAGINVEKDIAAEQAKVLGEALKQAKIDIVGGDNKFFDQIVNSITRGKSVDRMVQNSDVLGEIKSTFFDGSGNSEFTRQQLRKFVDQFGLSSEDVKNLSISALVAKLAAEADDEATEGTLIKIGKAVKEMGIGEKNASSLGIFDKEKKS